MTYKEYLALLLISALAGHFFWCLNVAYPIVIDTSIKKGKSWLYLPLRWKGFYKKSVQWFTPIFNMAIYVLVAVTLWLYLFSFSLAYFLGTMVIVVGLHFIIAEKAKKRRFTQQEDSFFFIRGKLQEDLETKGKSLSENEIFSLAAFQHQNSLREADQAGRLTEAIILQSKTAKSHQLHKKHQKS